jgi:osmoprotectant transport system ATP-binding protein
MDPKFATAGDTVIEFRNVTYRVNGIPARPIVTQISLTVSRGETLVLLGRSGSGKTTLLRLVNRMLLPSAGEILVNRQPTSQADPIPLRRGIGYVIQEGGLFPHFTIAENISLVPTLERWKEANRIIRLREMMQLVGLDFDSFANRYPRELSGGQRQRVGVARALAADPPILLMDEPFGALDPVTRAELQCEFQALAARLNKTILFVTHDLREALLLGARIALLHEGQLVALTTPSEFLRLDQPEARAFAASLDVSTGVRP